MNTIGINVYDGIQKLPPKTVPGWNSYNEIFGILVQMSQPKIIIEVGSWLGASAINMFYQTKKNNLDTKIYCVDTWLGATEFWTDSNDTSDRDLKLKNGFPQVYFDFLENVVSHNAEQSIVPIPNTSFIGAKILKYKNVMADLIYVDGSHEYEDVKQDIISYMDLLRPGGFMFGDDFNQVWPGVRRAVTESFGENFRVHANNFWIYQKS